MKLRLLLPLLMLVSAAYADRQDEQSIYRISGTEALNITSTTTRSAEIPAAATGVRIVVSTNSHVAFGGVSVTANQSQTFLPAGVPEYFKLNRNNGNYAAFIRNSADGKVWMDYIYQ